MQKKIIKLTNKNRIVVKANKIIEASYKLTIQEQRIILYMASEIHSDDEEFKPVRLDIKDFADFLSVKNPNHTYMQQVTKDLLSKGITIKEPGKVLQVNWLSSAVYFLKEAVIELTFDPHLKPYLLKLKDRFTQYQLKNVIRLKHIYSIRFYELLKQYESIGHRAFDLDSLKKILDVAGDEYKLYGHFKAKILNPVKKEFELKYSLGELDFMFSYKENKKGRKIIGLSFEILKPVITTEPIKEPMNSNGSLEVETRFKDDLRALGLTDKQIKDILQQYSQDQIMRNIELTKKKQEIGELQKPPAFLFAAIRDDFALNHQTQAGIHPDQARLKKEARTCWMNNKGGCAAVWDIHKDSEGKNACFYCEKFKNKKSC